MTVAFTQSPQAMAYPPQTGVDPAQKKREKTGFSFGALLDVINPLQHIPIVSGIYRKITGDEIGHGARVAGGALYGGPVGMALGFVNAMVDEETGKDLSEHALALFEPDASQTPAAMPVKATPDMKGHPFGPEPVQRPPTERSPVSPIDREPLAPPIRPPMQNVPDTPSVVPDMTPDMPQLLSALDPLPLLKAQQDTTDQRETKRFPRSVNESNDNSGTPITTDVRDLSNDDAFSQVMMQALDKYRTLSSVPPQTFDSVN